MNCRTFQRNLEDYLQDGLDFSGRFGMERHAQQCISCGKEMAAALQLHQKMSELQWVKAPSNFESLILNEIGKRKTRGRFSVLRDVWIYGFGWPSWRSMILASSGFAILGFGIFYAFQRIAPNPPSVPSLTADAPAKKADKPVKGTDLVDQKDEPVAHVVRSFSKRLPAVERPKAVETAQSSGSPEKEYPMDQEVTDSEYVEYQVIGPDNRPLTIRLPRYRKTTEEYFIRNVSH
jgi:hypothetical protein